ncbi:MAG: PD-(D/E)XK nuclease family protein [Tidjanibacter sp.]|nr:PD-(D/E)XK nuclease family protein [Tidjanibacter sp.]
MQKFLESVAADLWQRWGEQVGELQVILPNERTRVFLNDALSRAAQRPLWSPKYISIDQLMTSLAGLERMDSIGAITELYKVYSAYPPEESFDTFYRWGEVLLSDFDAVDKYLIDAQMLFANVADLKDVDADLADYLDEQQIAIVKRFWREFDAEKRHSSHKERFLTIWRKLLPVYNDFRQSLAAQGKGYTGMIYRRAAEALKSEGAELPAGNYVVVGFNALSEAEKVLFDHLRKHHNASFYWDYDDYYLLDDKQEAGLFVRENLRRYPAPESFVLPSHFSEPKDMKVVAVATDSLQCKYVGEFVEEIVKKEKGIDKNTAIVLTDEGLLSPLLYSLPDSVGKVNITMGYPLRATLAYSFVERLLQLQLRARRTKAGRISFYHTDVEGLLTHPLLGLIDHKGCVELKSELVRRGRIHIDVELFEGLHPAIAKIFTHHDSWASLKEYLLGVIGEVAREALPKESRERRALTRECFGLIADALVRTDNSVGRCGVEMKLSTYVSLLKRVMQGVRIPYSGEPLRGVQVMGILETRNLDFRNVVILSMNDDNFPSGRISDISFIPYNLRFAYGMPTPRHNEGVYAYYFYRLIQRASRVDMVYHSINGDSAPCEHSRYIYQLDFESPHKLERVEKSLNVNLADRGQLRVEKKGDVLARLERFLNTKEHKAEKRLSPSALNNYLICSLRFYFQAIAGIRTEKEIEEGVDSALFGTIFHRAMELLYTPLVEHPQPPQPYLAALTPEEVHAAVVAAISDSYFGGESVSEEEYGGNLLVVRDTVEKYILTCLIPFDSSPERGDYRVYKLEHDMESDFHFSEDESVTFYGLSDRIDRLPDGRLRIVDYKTGSIHRSFAGIAGLMKEIPKKQNGAVLQTLIYAMMAERMQQRGELEGCGAIPSLYFVRYMHDPEYSFLLNDESLKVPVNNYADYREAFESQLAATLAELFNPEVPFVSTENEKNCEYCDFAKICQKG